MIGIRCQDAPSPCASIRKYSINWMLDVYTVTDLYAIFHRRINLTARCDNGHAATRIQGTARTTALIEGNSKSAGARDALLRTGLRSPRSRAVAPRDRIRARKPVQDGNATRL